MTEKNTANILLKILKNKFEVYHNFASQPLQNLCPTSVDRWILTWQLQVLKISVRNRRK